MDKQIKANGYIGFYNGKQFEITADSSYNAQQKLLPIVQQTTRKKVKGYDITIVLAEKDGLQVTHSTAIL